MVAGDRVVVYVGGQRARSQAFVATAEIIGMDDVSGVRRRRSPDSFDAGNQVVTWLRLGTVRELVPSVPIRGLLDSLSFTPSNKARWGVALMGGVRVIGDDDWGLIVPSGVKAVSAVEA
jgi:hypothetical protein